MQAHRPSPALVVSIVALIVALGGTAVAAKVLITSSGQIRNGAIAGVDLRDGTITKNKLSKGTIRSLTGARTSGSSIDSPGGAQAIEAHRQQGPDLPKGGSTTVVSLPLPAGTYAVFGKTTMTPYINDRGLLDTLLKDNKTIGGECNLDVGGTGDFAIAAIVSPGSANPATLNTQLTRTLDAPATATLTCTADSVHWNAANSSLIAIRVGTTSRQESR